MDPNKNWKQEVDAEVAQRSAAEPAPEQGQKRTASPDAADNFDQAVGDPNITVKQFTNDVEYMDNRGPLGSGD
jgi:hypothetical protein